MQRYGAWQSVSDFLRAVPQPGAFEGV